MYTIKEIVKAFELDNAMGKGAVNSARYVVDKYLKKNEDYAVTDGVIYVKDCGIELLTKYYLQRGLIKGDAKMSIVKEKGNRYFPNRHFAKKEKSPSLIEANKSYVVYALQDPLTSQFRYVGRSRNIIGRYYSHKNNTSHRNNLLNAWIDLLAENKIKPFLTILEVCRYENWHERERYWIDYFVGKGERLFNIKYGDQTISHLAKQNSKVKLPA